MGEKERKEYILSMDHVCHIMCVISFLFQELKSDSLPPVKKHLLKRLSSKQLVVANTKYTQENVIHTKVSAFNRA